MHATVPSGADGRLMGAATSTLAPPERTLGHLPLQTRHRVLKIGLHCAPAPLSESFS
jgi:hypothetical protein